MENWIPALFGLPFIAAVAVLLLRPLGRSAARGLALAGTLVTLLVALSVTGAYYRFIFDGPVLSTSVSEDGLRQLNPVQPKVEIKYPWLDLSPAMNGANSGRHLRLEFDLGLDGLSVNLILLTAVLCVSCVLVSWNAIGERATEFYACLLILEAGLIGVFCAFDLLLFYVFFEFTLIPLYFLVGIWGGPQRKFAAVKLFLYTLAGGMVTLVGLAALIVSVWDRTDLVTPFSIPDLARSLAANPLPPEWQIGLFLAISAGFFVKVPLFPFHTWLPLAHVEAPTAGSILLAGVLLKLGTYGFLRLCLPLFPDACVSWGVPLVGGLATIGIIYGSLCSLAQRDIKKLVAYSSVAHLGFCMLGLFALNKEGMTGGFLQMINHGLSTGALFLLIGMVYERYHTRMLDDLGGLARRLPLLTCCMVFISMASIGLPGLNGFVGEFLSLLGMFNRHPAYAVIGATGVILGAWYLLTMVQLAFFGPLKEPALGHHGESHAAAPAGDHVEPGHQTFDAHATDASHGDAAHGHDHGHGHAPAPLPDNGIRDMNLREFLGLAPLAALCLLIGVYPQPLIDTIRPDIDAVAELYVPSGMSGRPRLTAPLAAAQENAASPLPSLAKSSLRD
jgi:NADH-quinone oxidoreductase subunit M